MALTLTPITYRLSYYRPYSGELEDDEDEQEESENSTSCSES